MSSASFRCIRLKLALAYDGTAYSGWQIQEKTNPPPTIQGELEKAFFKLTGKKTRVFGSGRTDAGVHAWGQIAHVDVEDTARNRSRDWRNSLNAVLPADIRLLNVHIAPPDFHSRIDAISKTYVYQLWQEPKFTPPDLFRYVWSCGPLNVEILRNAMSGFLGQHDFASFQNAGTKVNSTIRSILDINIDIIPPIEYLPAHLPLIRLTITADGFLKQMCRNIAGFLVYVAKKKIKADSLPSILASADRRALPSPTAPAKGLTLAKVSYKNKNCF